MRRGLITDGAIENGVVGMLGKLELGSVEERDVGVCPGG